MIKAVLFIIGFGICLYPVIGSATAQYRLNHVVDTYEKKVENCDRTYLNELTENAREYNEALYRSKEGLAEEKYQELLNIAGTGIMGSIEIPKIDVNLPIYHGTSEEVLSVGVGHVEGTSLPVGGIGTRAVLSGHRGLPDAKLFTRLDELELGDLFFLHMLGKVLAYKVVEIEIIKPDETDVLSIVPEKDLTTLVTCTPYGLNTHRLIVTGERVPYTESEYQEIESEIGSLREVAFSGLPFFFAFLGIGKLVRVKKKKHGKVRIKGGRRKCVSRK